MSFSKSTFSIYLLTFPFLLQTIFSADPLNHICSISENFTANSPYESNLSKLSGNLYIQTPQTGFGFNSSGQYPDQIYGLSLCRGDISASDCKACVVEASSEIPKLCPNNKEAIIWYDNCYFKYSDKDFFGLIDNINKFYLPSSRVVSDPIEFNGKTKEFLSQLANEAYSNPKMYLSGESGDDNNKLYGLVQCSRDLSIGDCKKCLDDIIAQLPSCCDGKEGGRVVSGSCNFRYEIYPFVNAS